MEALPEGSQEDEDAELYYSKRFATERRGAAGQGSGCTAGKGEQTTTRYELAATWIINCSRVRSQATPASSSLGAPGWIPTACKLNALGAAAAVCENHRLQLRSYFLRQQYLTSVYHVGISYRYLSIGKLIASKARLKGFR